MTMTFGTRFRVTLFGTSHGPEVGASIEGVPASTAVDLPRLLEELDRRRPFGGRLASRRRERDLLGVDSGIEDGSATGGPIRAHVANEDVRRSPYEALRGRPRPGHADYPATVRYGVDADLSGGGIFSGRMTVGLVVAGAIARGLLEPRGIALLAYTRSIGTVVDRTRWRGPVERERLRRDATEIGALGAARAAAMARLVESVRRSADSVGGTVEARATGVPVGWGEPFFDSVESELAHLLFSVPAVKGVEVGDGFAVGRMRGSENNDPFYWTDDGRVATRSNHSGGVLGGLTTGGDVVVRVAVKPTSSIPRPQETVDLIRRTSATIVVKGRHDPCIVPRAVPVVEACLGIVLADLSLRAEGTG